MIKIILHPFVLYSLTGWIRKEEMFWETRAIVHWPGISQWLKESIVQLRGLAGSKCAFERRRLVSFGAFRALMNGYPYE